MEKKPQIYVPVRYLARTTKTFLHTFEEKKVLNLIFQNIYDKKCWLRTRGPVSGPIHFFPTSLILYIYPRYI